MEEENGRGQGPNRYSRSSKSSRSARSPRRRRVSSIALSDARPTVPHDDLQLQLSDSENTGYDINQHPLEDDLGEQEECLWDCSRCGCQNVECRACAHCEKYFCEACQVLAVYKNACNDGSAHNFPVRATGRGDDQCACDRCGRQKDEKQLVQCTTCCRTFCTFCSAVGPRESPCVGSTGVPHTFSLTAPLRTPDSLSDVKESKAVPIEREFHDPCQRCGTRAKCLECKTCSVSHCRMCQSLSAERNTCLPTGGKHSYKNPPCDRCNISSQEQLERCIVCAQSFCPLCRSLSSLKNICERNGGQHMYTLEAVEDLGKPGDAQDDGGAVGLFDTPEMEVTRLQLWKGLCTRCRAEDEVGKCIKCSYHFCVRCRSVSTKCEEGSHEYVTVTLVACSLCFKMEEVAPLKCVKCSQLFCESCRGLGVTKNMCLMGGGLHNFTAKEESSGFFVRRKLEDDDSAMGLYIGDSAGQDGENQFFGFGGIGSGAQETLEVETGKCSNCNDTGKVATCTACVKALCVRCREVSPQCQNGNDHTFPKKKLEPCNRCGRNEVESDAQWCAKCKLSFCVDCQELPMLRNLCTHGGRHAYTTRDAAMRPSPSASPAASPAASSAAPSALTASLSSRVLDEMDEEDGSMGLFDAPEQSVVMRHTEEGVCTACRKTDGEVATCTACTVSLCETCAVSNKCSAVGGGRAHIFRMVTVVACALCFDVRNDTNECTKCQQNFCEECRSLPFLKNTCSLGGRHAYGEKRIKSPEKLRVGNISVPKDGLMYGACYRCRKTDRETAMCTGCSERFCRHCCKLKANKNSCDRSAAGHSFVLIPPSKTNKEGPGSARLKTVPPSPGEGRGDDRVSESESESMQSISETCSQPKSSACDKCGSSKRVCRGCTQCSLQYCEECQKQSSLRNPCSNGGGKHVFAAASKLQACSRCCCDTGDNWQSCAQCKQSFCSACANLPVLKNSCLSGGPHVFPSLGSTGFSTTQSASAAPTTSKSKPTKSTSFPTISPPAPPVENEHQMTAVNSAEREVSPIFGGADKADSVAPAAVSRPSVRIISKPAGLRPKVTRKSSEKLQKEVVPPSSGPPVRECGQCSAREDDPESIFKECTACNTVFCMACGNRKPVRNPCKVMGAHSFSNPSNSDPPDTGEGEGAAKSGGWGFLKRKQSAKKEEQKRDDGRK